MGSFSLKLLDIISAMKIHISAASLREIAESEKIEIRLEEAIDCEGGSCNSCVFDDGGELQNLPSHYHFVVSGHEPESGPRSCAIGESLPRLLD